MDRDGGTVEESLATRAGRLFAAYRDGDEARMAELVQILTPILWHTARASRLDSATAEDVLQTVWLTLVRKADSITEPLAVLQWMVVTTKREAWRVSRTQTKVRPEDLETSGHLRRRTTPSRWRTPCSAPRPRTGSGSTSKPCPSAAGPCCG